MNIYGIFFCSSMFLLCVAILWASENEEKVREFFFNVFSYEKEDEW